MVKHFGNSPRIEQLLSRIAAGDANAREELIRESQERLCRLASKMLKGFPVVARYAGETGDVLNPVLGRLFVKLQQVKFGSGRDFIAYAATMIRMELLDLARKYQREAGKRATNHPGPSGGAPLADAVDPARQSGIQEWEQLHEAVEMLPEDERCAIDLRYFGGYSRQETAAILGISERNVTRLYGRAIEKLGHALGKIDHE